MTAAAPIVADGQLAAPAPQPGTVSPGRRAARISAGVWAAMMLAALAGVALTFVARDDFKGGDLVFNLADLAAAVAYATLGSLVVRRAGNLIGWLMLAEGAGLVFIALASTYGLLGMATFPGDLPAATQVGTLAECSFPSIMFIIAFMLFLFPAGKLPSRRWRPVAAAGLLLAGLTTIGLVLRPRPVKVPAPGGVSASFANPFGTAQQPPVLRTVLIGTLNGLAVAFVAFLAVVFVSLAVRYRTGSRLLRQQIKWLALAAGGALASLLAALLSIWAGQPWLTSVAYDVVAIIALFGIPAAMTIAILKHQLYDIDRILSRTLAYVIVTALLVGVYAGVVLLTTQVLSFSSPVAVAASTLAAAGLFSPLRRRVQQAVDRRFNRTRYDADRTVAAFAARLQGEVDIDTVRADLLMTVHQALEPAQMSAWLIGDPRG